LTNFLSENLKCPLLLSDKQYMFIGGFMMGFKRVLVILMAIVLTACGEGSGSCTEPLAADDARPDILIIGDSISMGYTPTVRDNLLSFDVIHNPCNGQDSRNGYQKIDQWLKMRPQWEAITFNHGLWDVSTFREVDGGDYYRYLRAEAIKIKAATAKPLFILTTDFP
jgi:hypothetical protein